jgi:hypothetical protein
MRNDKSQSDKDAGQRTPGGGATRDPEASTPEPHHRNLASTTKPSASQPIGPTAEGLAYRFLRSLPRVLGSGSLSRARPRLSEYNLTMHPDALNISTNSGDSNRALPKHPVAR